HQFHIETIVPIHIGGYDLSLTNFTLFMVVIVVLSGGLFYWAAAGRSIVPGRAQSLAELTYDFAASMLKDSAGNEGMRFFPFIFTLFMFILMANLLGMFPCFPTVTSQLVVTAGLALLVFFTVIIAGLLRNGLHFFKLFVPSGVPV